MEDKNHILAAFPIGEVKSIRPFGNGHINRTYLVEADGFYTFQELNTYVFGHPLEVMENIEKVTLFLREKIEAEGGDVNRETPSVVRTKDGELLHFEDGKCYRMLVFVPHSKAHERAESPRVLYEAGRAFGRFQKRLSDFPAEELFETIPDFHHTPKRMMHLRRAVAEDVKGRLSDVRQLVDEAFSHEDLSSLVTEKIETGEIPLRVTHNDTKLNNALLDDETGEGLCVIDLDTVMPGSILYDFGEAIRTGVTDAMEHETDAEKIGVSMEKFSAFAEGFLGEVGESLKESEWELLYKAPQLMTFENAIRFLTDYLEGDPYFGSSYEGQNKDRARMHLTLLSRFIEKEEEMKQAIEIIRNKKREP